MVELEEPETDQRLALDADGFRRDYLTNSTPSATTIAASAFRPASTTWPRHQHAVRQGVDASTWSEDEKSKGEIGISGSQILDCNASLRSLRNLPSNCLMTFLHLSLLAGRPDRRADRAAPDDAAEAERLEFPALRFIQKRHDVNQRRLQLRHLLLLLLRVAAIALLALAPWRGRASSWPAAWAARRRRWRPALVFDAAPHMEYRHENRTRLEVARELGQWLVSQLPEESQIAVLDTRPGSTAALHAGPGRREGADRPLGDRVEQPAVDRGGRSGRQAAGQERASQGNLRAHRSFARAPGRPSRPRRCGSNWPLCPTAACTSST